MYSIPTDLWYLPRADQQTVIDEDPLLRLTFHFKIEVE